MIRTERWGLIILWLAALLVSGGGSAGQQTKDRKGTGAASVHGKVDSASGKLTFEKHCAACHGETGKGDGPVAKVLKPSPTDLTALAKNNKGKFPEGFVAAALKFGRNLSAHGSQDMPVWGERFQAMDPERDPTGQQHVDDLLAYLKTLQVR
ncbi:MAG TPA: cytochrome c [Candidatus Acidoferrum sp.]|jgi:mono/diheme cytochrome c family protein